MSFSNPSELIGSLGWLSIVILLILATFSVVSWGIIVYKLRRFKKITEEETQFLRSYELNSVDQLSLKADAKTLPLSPSSAVFLGVCERIPSSSSLFHPQMNLEAQTEERFPSRPYLEKVANHIIQNQINQQEAYLPFLATTGNLTPFIGLLGTVLGIINAFGEIGVQGSASIAAVAPGVSEALVATAAGLFAAIPAVMAYNYFLSRMRKLAFRVEAFSIEFLNAIEEYEKTLKEKEVEITR
ncbi:MAG: MotA/TolQ/ExbB proton channel family protein [Nitrospirales bacterium]